jgi:hypothetical protein
MAVPGSVSLLLQEFWVAGYFAPNTNSRAIQPTYTAVLILTNNRAIQPTYSAVFILTNNRAIQPTYS